MGSLGDALAQQYASKKIALARRYIIENADGYMLLDKIPTEFKSIKALDAWYAANIPADWKPS